MMIDLHMHSCYSSDGEFSPAELVAQCRRAGVRMLSVTDHNCAGANAEAARHAALCGLAYVTGIEIDCTFQEVNLHVLGYGIDAQSRDFVEIADNVARQNRSASLERLEKTQALGFQVTEEELRVLSRDRTQQDEWTGEMFAEVLLHKPAYAAHPLLQPYRPGGARSDNPYVNFYWDYYAQDKLCYAALSYPTLAEVVEIIHRNGGKAVLAHPAVNVKENTCLLDAICTQGLDGIEAYSSYHTAAQAAHFCRKAQQKGLLITCGSDYHGKTKPAIRLGQHGANAQAEAALLRALGCN